MNFRRFPKIWAVFAAVIALSAGLQSPAVASPTANARFEGSVVDFEPVPPSTACEWYGAMSSEFDEEISWDGADAGNSHQVTRESVAVESAPVDGEDCGLRWTASYSMNFVLNTPGQCNPVVDTLSNEFSGTGTGSYTGEITGPDASGRFFPAFAASTTETMGGTVDVFHSGTCGEGGGSSSDPSSMAVTGISTVCHEDAVLTDYFVAADAQVASGSCVHTVSTSGDGYTTHSTRTTTWDLRRVVCDDSIDSDGGGVSDCEEYERGTNPHNPEDDTDTDTDGDGFVDSVDACASDAGVASAQGCPDADGDGVSDLGLDNCVGVANSGQDDLDGDGIGDACDPDADGDGYADTAEADAGLDPRDADTDDDTVLDGADTCPAVAGAPQNSGCPTGFSCDSAQKSSTIFDPTYTARIVVALSPDAHLYTFGPSFLACWNGIDADFDITTWEASTDSGLDTAVLDGLGFEIGYEPDSVSLTVDEPGGIAYARASAVFTVSFDPISLLDKLGVKGKIEQRATNLLAKKIERVLVRHGYGTPEFDQELLGWAEKVSDDFISAAEKVEQRLSRAGVADGLAKSVGDWAVREITERMRDFRVYVGTFASTSGLYDQGAEVIADRLVADLFGKLQPTLTFPMWEPVFDFALHPDGRIDTTDATTYVNPFLTITQVE